MDDKGDKAEPEVILSHDEGDKAEPEVIVSHDENYGLTGFFNDGRKRIDVVLVLKDDDSNELIKIRLFFLMNVIKFGLEAEVEQGKMPEHRNLIFVKLHAPDAIIEEFGIYFSEKTLFKDSHLEFVNPVFNIFGVSNERELIKIVRKQYSGPDNYSTLERSNIVYKILLRLPFGRYKNHFGINKLIDNNIIEDVFALHDGPYFILPKQRLAKINARQVLFFEWLGLINVFKMQPIHMIHEYFGKRVSYYFTFYEYFNFMLIIPLIIGVISILLLRESRYNLGPYEDIQSRPCSSWREFVCPECRNPLLCPLLREDAYCEELKLLAIIDKETTHRLGDIMALWGIFFLIPWRYGERYLTWIWEETKSYTQELVSEENKMTSEKKIWNFGPKWLRKLEGTPSRILIYMATAIFLGLWGFLMFRVSMIIWYYPRWKRLQIKNKYAYKEGENENLAVGAGMYTIFVYVIKMVRAFKLKSLRGRSHGQHIGSSILAQIVTDYENNERLVMYDRSIALKMYAFNFIGTYFILITYTYIGSVYKYQPLYTPNQLNYMMYGYAMMNSGLGSAFDDISVTLAVITILEHVIFRIPGFFIKHETDYPVVSNKKVPCWEREYKLKPITDLFFHKRYCALAMQFALLSCYSMMFPLAPLFIFIINIWDLRHTARQFLLEYRRPLLTNTSGPGFWKFLIFATAFYAPMSNFAIIIFQSLASPRRYFISSPNFFVIESKYNNHDLKSYKYSETDFNNMIELLKKDQSVPGSCILLEIRDFPRRIVPAVQTEVTGRYMILTTLFNVALGFLLFYVFPETSNSLEEAIKKEQRIKNKYQSRRVLLNELMNKLHK